MPGRQTLLAVLLTFAACRRGHVDTELEVLPTSPVVSIHRLSLVGHCAGTFVQRLACEVQGPPVTSCVYGLVHTGERLVRPADCAMVSGWRGAPSALEPSLSVLQSERSATGTTFMIQQPGVEGPFRVEHATIPDAGLRLGVGYGDLGHLFFMHHVDSSGVFFSHRVYDGADAGLLSSPLAALLGPGFWSMHPAQRDEAWPVILREDPNGAPVVLTAGHDDPSYDRYFSMLTPEQRAVFFDIQRAFFEVWVDHHSSSLGGTSLFDLNIYSFIRWVFAHPELEPDWFLSLARTVKEENQHLVHEYLALRGDGAALDRTCESEDLSEEGLAIIALTGHQCQRVVEEIAELEQGLWMHRGKPCEVEDSRRAARETLAHVLPLSMRVDAGVAERSGCGPFLAALSVQRAAPAELRRRYERLRYPVVRVNEPCRDVEMELLRLSGKQTRRTYLPRYDEGSEPDTSCEIVIDDRKRSIRVTGTSLRPPSDDAADE